MSFMHGSSLLLGNNTVPGVQLSKELKEYAPIILKACRDWGLDFYPTVIQLLTYDEISEIAAYGGFPVRYPHWTFGMEYEELQRGYQYGMHRIYEMVINCLAPDTQILTNKGSKNAGEIKSGDIVMGARGWRDVVAVKKQKSSKVFQITCEELSLKTICTPNHKWKCVRSGEDVWVETKDIKIGDAIQAGADYDYFLGNPFEIKWTAEKVIEKTRKNIRNQLIPISPPDKMTLELAELMGILTGDGSVGVRLASNTLNVCIHKPLIDFQKHVFNLFHNVFGREPSIYEKKKSVNLISLSSKFAVDYLNSIGFKTGSTYRNKRVPFSIFASSNEYRAAFLRGLFDTDGYCGKYLSLSCFSDELAQDIQLLLLEMGIRSKVKRVKNKNNDIAVLLIKGLPNLVSFEQKIGFSLNYKAEALAVLTSRDGRSGRGQILPGVMDKIFAKIDSMDKPPEWMYKWRKRTLQKDKTTNSLYGFLHKAMNEGYGNCFKDLYELVKKPVYVVSKIEELEEEQETIDIALDHDDHDFLANGLVSHNTNPCYQWLLSSNTLVDNLTVIAHATGHNDFFKNNIYFSATDTNMLNKMANHGTRIRKYMARWGKERVIEFLDLVKRIDTLIDGADAWKEKVVKDVIIRDERKYNYPKRLNVDKERLYMEPFLNTQGFKDRENEKVKRKDISEEIGFFKNPTKNIMAFLRDNAPLKPWQADIMSMLYDEAIYFYPQRQTKVLNEGWASMTDSVIMAEQGYVSLGQPSHDCGIFEYAEHKMGVLGGKYSNNPYKLGYNLLCDIRKRWDNGQFGTDWEDCNNMREKENWNDTHAPANLGKDKIFEVRKYYNDLTLIHEFFTEDFCREQEYFQWKKLNNGNIIISSRDYKNIKDSLMKKHLNGGLPNIKLIEPDYKGKGAMLLEHESDGRPIYEPYIEDVMNAIKKIWNNDVYFINKNDGKEKIHCSYNFRNTPGQIQYEVVSREEHLKS